MKEKKLIIVKRVSKAEEFRAPELDHCKFVAITRVGGDGPQDLDDERAVGTALSSGYRVLAVCNIPVPVPFVVLNVKALNDNRIMHVSGFITVRLNTGMDFYEWVLSKLKKCSEVLDADFWEELYCRYGLDDYFKHLVNSEKVVQLEKHGMYATDFPDINEKFKNWFTFNSVDSFRVENANDEPSAALMRCMNAVDKAMQPSIIDEIGKTWLNRLVQALKDHPLKTIAGLVCALIVIYIAHGCLSSYSQEKDARDHLRGIKHATEIAKAAELKPVKGSISIRMEDGAGTRAAKILNDAAAAFARDTVSEKSGKAKAWTNARKIELPAKDWAQIVTRTQSFAAESAGEFTCEISGNDITIVPHPDRVREYVLDVAFLRGNAELVGKVSKAFGVGFAGQAKVGPLPIRANIRRSALRSLDGSEVRVEAIGEGNEMVFSPNFSHLAKADASVACMNDAEISKKADEFWTEVAAAKFVTIPKAYADLTARFEPYNKDLTDGFEEAGSELESLKLDVEDKIAEGKAFLGECDKPWRQYSEAKPADKNSKVKAVSDTVKSLELLQASISARSNSIAYDKDVAAFKKGKDEFIYWATEMLKCYHEQQARIARMGQIRQEIVNARAANDFGKIPAFEAQISEAENSQRANRQREMQIGQYVASVCNKQYFDQTFGSGWVKGIVRRHSANVAGVDAKARMLTADFSSDIQRLFGASTLDKALARGIQLAESVADNHREARDGKTLSEMGSEVAYISGLRNDIIVLKRVQRKYSK